MDCNIRNYLRHLKIEVKNYYKCRSRVIPKTKMRTETIKLILKLTIPEEKINAHKIKAVVRKYNIFTAQVSKTWKYMLERLAANLGDSVIDRELQNKNGFPRQM